MGSKFVDPSFCSTESHSCFGQEQDPCHPAPREEISVQIISFQWFPRYWRRGLSATSDRENVSKGCAPRIRGVIRVILKHFRNPSGGVVIPGLFENRVHQEIGSPGDGRFLLVHFHLWRWARRRGGRAGSFESQDRKKRVLPHMLSCKSSHSTTFAKGSPVKMLPCVGHFPTTVSDKSDMLFREKPT